MDGKDLPGEMISSPLNQVYYTGEVGFVYGQWSGKGNGDYWQNYVWGQAGNDQFQIKPARRSRIGAEAQRKFAPILFRDRADHRGSSFKCCGIWSASRDLSSGLIESSLSLTLGFKPVDIACRGFFNRFNGLPRQCRFGKPLKTALTGPFLMCTRLKAGVNDIRPVAEALHH